MRDKLFNIIMSAESPVMKNGEKIYGLKLVPEWMAVKLADHLIKNGIIVPTFIVGDIVWVYDFMWGILPCEVDRPYHCRCGKEGGCTFEMTFSEADIGDLVFATKEEAEVYWYEKG